MLWRRRLGGLVRRGLGLGPFGCGRGLRRRGIRGRRRSFGGCVAGVAVVGGVEVVAVVVAAGGARIASSLCFGGRVGLRRGWLARCLGRRGRVRARGWRGVGGRGLAGGRGGRRLEEGVVVAGCGGMEGERLRRAASCREQLRARMPS